MRAHLWPHFEVPQNISKATIADFGRQRLKVVKRNTVKKDRSVLRGFLDWCHERGYLAELPEFPMLPRRAPGTPYAIRRRGKATPLSPEECRALIAALPRWGQGRKGVPKFVVRARFIVAYETALRPATLDKLSIPQHYTRGSASLRIADEIDKARFGREVPLTDAAREALDSVALADGPIFGRHEYRYHLERAAHRVLPPARAATFAAYDLRHARLTELARKGDLPGVAYLAGHKQVSTTSIYVRPGLRAAEAVLRAFGDTVGTGGSTSTDRSVLVSTAAELRTLEPPRNVEQLTLEWQMLVNVAAAQLEAREADATKVKPKRRIRAPKEDTALDALVEATIASGRFSSQHQLRAEIGCKLDRVRRSLERLTQAGRIRRESKAVAGPAPPFLVRAE